MRITLRCVEEEIRDAAARDMRCFWRDVGEEDARGDVRAGPFTGGREEVRGAVCGEAEEPEVGVGHAGEDAQPGAEGRWVDLWVGCQCG